MTSQRNAPSLLGRLALMALFTVAACGDDGGQPASPDIETTDGPISDATTTTPDSVAVDSVEDSSEEIEIIYPGHNCGGDEQCSTGLCYGFATPQGAFENPKCQSLCLDLNDFGRYCDSDDDCCKGRCCIGCGAREGLCILD